MHIRKKINQAQSNYSKGALQGYNSRITQHKDILKSKSPNRMMLDPLVGKVKSNLHR